MRLPVRTANQFFGGLTWCQALAASPKECVVMGDSYYTCYNEPNETGLHHSSGHGAQMFSTMNSKTLRFGSGGTTGARVPGPIPNLRRGTTVRR